MTGLGAGLGIGFATGVGIDVSAILQVHRSLSQAGDNCTYLPHIKSTYICTIQRWRKGSLCQDMRAWMCVHASGIRALTLQPASVHSICQLV